MAMMRFNLFVGFEPFHDTPVLADRRRHQAGTLGSQFAGESRIKS